MDELKKYRQMLKDIEAHIKYLTEASKHIKNHIKFLEKSEPIPAPVEKDEVPPVEHIE